MSDQEQIEQAEHLAAPALIAPPSPLSAAEVSALVDSRIAAWWGAKMGEWHNTPGKLEVVPPADLQFHRLEILKLLTQHSANSGQTAETVVQRAKILEAYLREG